MIERSISYFLILFISSAMLQSCESDSSLLSTEKILVTSESGDKLTEKENIQFRKGQAEDAILTESAVLTINPEVRKQLINGIGTSFTESSAFVLAHLDPPRRMEVMEAIYGETGANFSLARTHIGSCDFTVEGKYSYLEKEGDTALESFSIAPDKKGFRKSAYPGVKDEQYDLLPMIKEALSIKRSQEDQHLAIVASAWTAPAWMKDIETYYIKGTPENNYQGTGGSLKEKYEATYADYLVRYLDAYQAEGVDIWGMTPVNEPHGNNGQWESMHFTPESQNEFIKQYLGPKLHSGDHKGVKLLIFDQNRDALEHWTDVILGDEETSQYVYGAAVHWYASTFKVYEDVFERVHAQFPEKAIIHTEGCIDDLGKPAPEGITDPEGFQEENWFNNDAFWWNPNATDWAYTATWPGVIEENHPIYTPVHRYARNIIVSLDHWMRGWIDWNIVLDHNGGPNHVGNYCGAPIMINTETSHVYYTPIYYILAQFSKTIRPGDHAVQTNLELKGHGSDALHACATINADNLLSVQLLNTTREDISCSLQVRDQYCEIRVDKNSLKTLQIRL